MVELRPGKIGEINILGSKMPVVVTNKVKKDSSTIYFPKTKKQQGKRNRANGKAFEIRVREDLESKGWIVFRNSNDVDFETSYNDEGFKMPYPEGVKVGKFKQAKTKWNFYTKTPMSLQSGFPDFVCIKQDFEVDASELMGKVKGDLFITGNSEISMDSKEITNLRKSILSSIVNPRFKVQFVEVKTNGYLDKIEREKVEWIKNNLKIPVLIASKEKEKGRIKIIYE